LGALFLLTGCPPRSAYVPTGEPGTTTSAFDPHDYNLVLKKMVESMLRNGLKTEEGKIPVIRFGNIFNKTPYQIETRKIQEDIRIDVMNSGLAKFSTYADPTKKGSESGELYKEMDFQNEEDYVNPETVKKKGQLVGADYILYGNIYNIERANREIAESNFSLELTLQDVNTGLAVWSDKKEIRKNIGR
jgi:hypothetical protein